MGKWTALKEVGGAELADIDPDTVGSIYDEGELGLPPKGPYLAVLKRLQATETKADSTPMMKMVFEIAEPKGSKKGKYNGYGIWFYRTIQQEHAGRVNAFLHALFDGKTPAQRKKLIEAFWSGNVVTDDDNMIVKIGTWNVPDAIPIGINTRVETYNDEKKLAISSVMPASDRPASKVEVEPDDEDEDDEDTAAEDEGDVDEEADEEIAARQEELEKLTLAKLKIEAKNAGAKLADYKGHDKGELIDLILDLEFPVEEDEEPEDEEEPEEEEEGEEEDPEDDEDEFGAMERAELKKYITSEKLGIKVTTKMSDDDVREAIREAIGAAEAEEPEEEEEEEPEPTPVRRGRPAAKAASPARPAAKRRRGSASDSEPPF